MVEGAEEFRTRKVWARRGELLDETSRPRQRSHHPRQQHRRPRRRSSSLASQPHRPNRCHPYHYSRLPRLYFLTRNWSLGV